MRVDKLFEAKGIHLGKDGYEGSFTGMSRHNLRAHKDDKTIEIRGADLEEFIEELGKAVFDFFTSSS